MGCLLLAKEGNLLSVFFSGQSGIDVKESLRILFAKTWSVVRQPVEVLAWYGYIV
jgi:hypothetical protein